MVDNCKHVRKIRVAKDHSILNPQKWLCKVCGTTESVWACLGCANVACGRYIEEHALAHFKQTKHPLAIEVNDKYVFCYECHEYVLNDNAGGDLKLLRNALCAIATQNFDCMEKRGNRMLRSKSFTSFSSDAQKLIQEDKCHTAIVHRRMSLLQGVFSQWKDGAQRKRPESFLRKPAPVRRTPVKPVPKLRAATAPAALGAHAAPPRKKKRTILPGVVGLRNLGNTCYMNAILQVLSFSFSSLDELRQYFAEEQLQEQKAAAAAAAAVAAAAAEGHSSGGCESAGACQPRQSARLLERQTTVECYERASFEQCTHQKGGLNGGGTVRELKHSKKSNNNNSSQLVKREPPKSLSNELHALFRVMWSGKWAIVSPHSLLHAVWNVIPFFKGYTQQDAQEFMCEFLDKVENEIQSESCQRQKLMRIASNVVKDTFQGEIVSEVTCLSCSNANRTYEPFYDLSLEFPDRYQMTRVYRVVSEDSCHLTEMLAKFTEDEMLEGKIYSCTKCNLKRRRASNKPVVLTQAKKQLQINKLPKVLRLHLKRFRWSGRNHREKINVHVTFDEELDMAPFVSNTDADDKAGRCTVDGSVSAAEPPPSLYQLSAVVIHHGRGFSSGHYTAYCWNDEAESWVHCNDARVEPCQLTNVLRSQAYILLYTRKGEKIELDQLADLHQDLVAGAVHDEQMEFLTDTSSIVNIDDDVSFKLEPAALLSMPSLMLDDYSEADRAPDTDCVDDGDLANGALTMPVLELEESSHSRRSSCDPLVSGDEAPGTGVAKSGVAASRRRSCDVEDVTPASTAKRSRTTTL